MGCRNRQKREASELYNTQQATFVLDPEIPTLALKDNIVLDEERVADFWKGSTYRLNGFYYWTVVRMQ